MAQTTLWKVLAAGLPAAVFMCGFSLAQAKDPVVDARKDSATQLSWTVTPGDVGVTDFHVCLRGGLAIKGKSLADWDKLDESERLKVVQFMSTLGDKAREQKLPKDWKVGADWDVVTHRYCIAYKGPVLKERFTFVLHLTESDDLKGMLRKPRIFVTGLDPDYEPDQNSADYSRAVSEAWHKSALFPKSYDPKAPNQTPPKVDTYESEKNKVTYEVTPGSAEVRDLHVCMRGPDHDDAEFQKKTEKALNARDVLYMPPGWNAEFRFDSETRLWCIDFYAGVDGDPISDKAKDRFFGINKLPNDATFKDLRAGLAKLYATDSDVGEQDTWHDHILNPVDTGTAKPKPFTLWGPELAVASVEPAPSTGAVVLIGTVNAEAAGTGSVLTLSGVVVGPGVAVKVGEKEYVTDSEGHFSFAVPAGLTTLTAMLPGNSGSEVTVPVLPATRLPSTVPPTITTAPTFVATGQTFPVDGKGFSGAAESNTVKLADLQLKVMASSPSQLVVAAPVQAPLGTQQLTVSTAQGSSNPQPVTLVSIRLESGNTKLHTGQNGVATLVVQGTNKRMTLNVTNLAPQTISLSGGTKIAVRTSGGANNRAAIKYHALHLGNFQISAEVAANKR